VLITGNSSGEEDVAQDRAGATQQTEAAEGCYKEDFDREAAGLTERSERPTIGACERNG